MKVTKSLQRSAIGTLIFTFAVWAAPLLAKAQSTPNAQSSRRNQTDDLDVQLVSGRLIVHPPVHPLRLGEKNPVEITLKGPGVTCLMPSTADDDAECSSIQRHTDGKTYVDVVPQELGEMDVEFVVFFADRGLESEHVHVMVTPPHPPLRLDVGVMMPIDGRSMLFLTVGEQRKIFVTAEFAGFLNPVLIPKKDLKFRLIRQSKGEPAIRFDPSTGSIVAERLGDALIESSYAGAKQTTCVMVTEHRGYSRGNCEELRESGKGIVQ